MALTADLPTPPAPFPARSEALTGRGEAMDGFDRVRELPLDQVATADVGQLTAALARLEAQVHALGLAVLAEACSCDLFSRSI